MKDTINCTLNELGRKDSLLKGGDGKRNQTLMLMTGVLLSVMTLVPVTSAAVTWDVRNGFSSTANPNTPWEYGSRALVASLSLTTYPIHEYWNGWASAWETVEGSATGFDGGHTYVEMWKATAGSWDGISRYSIAAPWTFMPGIAAGDIGLSGGAAAAVIRWTAPTDGLYSVSATYGVPDNRYDSGNPGPTSLAYVLTNGVIQGSGAVTLFGDTYSFTQTDMALFAGDTIEFVVSGAKGTQLTGLITLQAPEPSSLALLSLGGLSLIRRKKNVMEL